MHLSTRRQFLQTSATLAAAALLGSSFDTKKYNPLLSFSTLGCPDWTFEQITDFAVKHGFKGLEIRGLLRQIDLTKAEPFATAEKRAVTMAMMKEKGLVFVNLGSSATLHFANEADRKKNLDDGRKFIDLAQQINCPFIRVYPNNFPKDQEKQQTMDLIAKGLLELGEYGKAHNVKVLMETHGEVVKTEDLASIMQAASHSHVGLVWDPCNMWTVTKESPIAMYKQLKKYIHHTHIKDAKLVDGKPQYVLLGQGEVPIFEAIDVLAKDNYKGYFSFEWEKLWHPELLEPEIALADYPLAMKKHFKK
ncbi:sugar phosphate isomerase/epimerase family protein [Terrimonas alba]|uniref:sugar phosphate isomerase/epimerase family protein n=1 Tax=Terrimonas alba TaxID=3349636 RepID=UPI0035F3D5F1